MFERSREVSQVTDPIMFRLKDRSRAGNRSPHFHPARILLLTGSNLALGFRVDTPLAGSQNFAPHTCD